MNLEKLAVSRRKPCVGDVFVVKPVGHPYFFGRVIRDDALPLGKEGGCALLLYVYNVHAESLAAVPARLSRDNLLIVPTFSNSLGWRHGYFQTVRTGALGEGDVLDVHCFRQPFMSPTGLIDEYARPLPKGTPSIDLAGLDSYRTIDVAISKALGLPMASAGEDEDDL